MNKPQMKSPAKTPAPAAQKPTPKQIGFAGKKVAGNDPSIEKATRTLARAFENRENVQANFGKLMKLNLAMMGLVVVMAIAVVVSNIYNGVQKQILGMTETGRIIKIDPLHEAVLNMNILSRFADDALSLAFSLDFANWRTDMTLTRSYFTVDGYENYEKTLKDSGWLDRVVAQKSVMTYKSTGPWVLTRRGTINGAASYELQAPGAVEFVRAGQSSTIRGLFTVSLIRSSKIDNPAGLQVNKFLFTNG